MRRLRLLALFVAVLSVPSVALVFASEPSVAWPQFRGPAGAGILGEGTLPTRWSAKESIVWGVEIQGRGWSSPVAWNDTVFVTSAISPGAFKAPSTGIFGNDYVAELAKQGLSEDEVVKKVSEQAGVGMGKVAQPVRVAATGGTVSPGIGETLELLGREETLHRLDAALARP